MSYLQSCNLVNLWSSTLRQEKEAWIKSKYVEKRFLKKMSGSEALVEGERKSRPWTVKKCQRHSSSVRAPNKARRKYHRYEPGSASPANLSAGKWGELTSVVINVKNLTQKNIVPTHSEGPPKHMIWYFIFWQRQQQSFAGTHSSVQMSWIHYFPTLTLALVLAVSPLHSQSIQA